MITWFTWIYEFMFYVINLVILRWRKIGPSSLVLLFGHQDSTPGRQASACDLVEEWWVLFSNRHHRYSYRNLVLNCYLILCGSKCRVQAQSYNTQLLKLQAVVSQMCVLDYKGTGQRVWRDISITDARKTDQRPCFIIDKRVSIINFAYKRTSLW